MAIRTTYNGAGMRQEARQARLQAALRDVPGLRLAVLFGSTAVGTARDNSDLDVGIALDQPHALSPSAIVGLERAAGRAVDVVVLDSAPPLLRFEIARTGLVLLERDPYAWADFQAKAMIDWWDWAPTMRVMRDATLARLQSEARRGPP